MGEKDNAYTEDTLVQQTTAEYLEQQRSGNSVAIVIDSKECQVRLDPTKLVAP